MKPPKQLIIGQLNSWPIKQTVHTSFQKHSFNL